MKIEKLKQIIDQHLQAGHVGLLTYRDHIEERFTEASLVTEPSASLLLTNKGEGVLYIPDYDDVLVINEVIHYGNNGEALGTIRFYTPVNVVIDAVSTPVDIDAEDFLDLVRNGCVTTASPYDGDDVPVLLSHVWRDQTEIQWGYDTLTEDRRLYESLGIREDDRVERVDHNTVGVRGRIFTITQ